MAEVAATGLAHIKEGRVNDAMLATHCIDWNWWVLRIEACVDITEPSVDLHVYVLGVQIGSCVLNPRESECKIGGGVDGFKAEVELKLVDNCRLVVVAEVCAAGYCKKFEHTLFQWC
ncbi:MAG TPA: hypothetical protein VE010_02740 [Thermoanaerobaculia bacterium]|nr:hypothetical protein [Thermoanaerobaculia bacterium]